MIDDATRQAYLETHYHVHGAAPTVLRIGVPNPALATLHHTLRVHSSAYITAWNPGSKILTDAENSQRQGALALELQRRGLPFIEGIGKHPSSGWAGEPSFLVFGLSLESAKTLGSRYQQAAILWCGGDSVPQLILLR